MTDFTKVKKALEKKGYPVQEFQTKEEAAQYLTEKIQGKTVGFGGSMTVDALGLMDRLKEKNTLYTHWKPAEGMSQKEVFKAAMNAEIYLSSVNALAETGEMVSIDATGNRISSQAFGHEKVYLIIGQNKLAKNLDFAMARAQEVAAPKTARRFPISTPCHDSEEIQCFHCQSPDKICRAYLVLAARPFGQDYEVILIHEDLGY